MSQRAKTIVTVGDCVVVEILDDPALGPRRFFGQKNGEVVTKGFADPVGVRNELEMMATRQAVQDNKWIVPAQYSALGPNIFYLYPLGRLLLLALTFGRYPGERHNRIFVAAFPGFLLAAVFALVTVFYS